MKFLLSIFVILAVALVTNASQKNNLKIIDGGLVNPHWAPYLVFLSIDGSMNLRCGASLISQNYVLTSANCMKTVKTVKVVLGADDVTQAESTQISFDVTPKDIKIHENFNEKTLENDIALIKLPKTVTLNENIQVIPIAKNGEVANLTGLEVITMGWGSESGLIPNLYSDTPHVIFINITANSNSSCTLVFKDKIKETNICCTQYNEWRGPNLNLCDGDYGGPLVYNFNLLVGVASFSGDPCTLAYPNVFTDVSRYTDWIATNSDVKMY